MAMNKYKLLITGSAAFAALSIMTVLLLVGVLDRPDSFVAGMVSSFQAFSGTAFFSIATVLGDWRGIFAVAFIATIALIRRGRTVEALSLAVILPITSVAYSLMKALTGRARPTVSADISSLSFPSGHAAMSAALYFSLIIVVARSMKAGYQRTSLIGVLVLVPVVVGLSRVYLEKHWATDVIAGWLLGIGIASLALMIFRTRSGS